MTNREAHEEAAGMGLEDAFFRFNKIDPDAPAERVALKDAVECLEAFGIGLAAEGKSTATALLRTRQCEIRSTAIFTVLDILDQYRKALENFGVTFADNGFIRKIPRDPTAVESREKAWTDLGINEWRLKLRSTTDQKKAAELLDAMYDAGFAAGPPRTTEARYRNALTEILTLRSRHAKDCHIIAHEALKGANQ
jgi:hypothetical protein